MKSLFSAALILGLLSATGVAALQPKGSFCGTIDFSVINNEGLERITFISNLEKGLQRDFTQCGLVGEYLSICQSCSEELPESSMRILRPMLGEKSHKDWHAKWHKIRSQSASINADLFGKLRNSGLVPPNLSRDEFFSWYRTGGELAGENFFYMHRMMIKMVQFELSLNALPCVSPWTDLPSSVDDELWPVPRTYESLQAKQKDEEKLELLRSKLTKYYRHAFLKSITLNDLGNLIESELHQNLHEFYRGSPVNSSEALLQGFQDDLLPVESSPLNKYFWKIHGLVDEILGQWLIANGYQEISLECSQDQHCYQWNGVWIGKYPRPTE